MSITTAAQRQQVLSVLAQRYTAIERDLRELSLLVTSASPSTARTAARHADAATLAAGPAAVDDARSSSSRHALQPCERDTAEVAALRRWCLQEGLYSARFEWVPSDYYSHTLQWRRDALKAATIHHLCKTIVLENTHCTKGDCATRTNSRFYMIVFQYTTRFDAQMVMRVIRELNPDLGKKKFNFRLAAPEQALALTGFAHGAVIPFGTREHIPVILSASLATLTPRNFWVGGGHVDCKVRVDFDEFVKVVDPIVAPITVAMTPEEFANIAD